MAELSLSELISATKTPEKTVREAEAEYHTALQNLAEKIVKKGLRIVFLAGPSAAGKTTSANLLSDAIKTHGLESYVISLDNFYRDHKDPDYPRLPDGSRDFETVDALNLSAISEVILKVIGGEEFTVPHYDFKEGHAVGEPYRYPGSKNSVVIIEGLHAINPKISSAVGASDSLSVFVSVSTNLYEGDTRLLSGKKMRFLRRLVRDNLYRGASAQRTLSLWENVLAGEEKYLYPYKSKADVALNTFHLFELPVLAPYAKKVLSAETISSDFVDTVRFALDKIPEMNISYVPEDSLIKEFVPGGIYENLY